MATTKKEEPKVVSATLATGTKVTAPQEVIDKVKVQAQRDAGSARTTK